ncbi:MAG: protein-L-isoaspartate(D-aspartate) O-methyltransferase [Burkholderiales bacterium]|nr:protein-L-isoaspartate(D-aspartate) O-methyltransferase [Burkholderiales bacterium]
MVDTTIRARGIRDPQVLRAMETVPRQLFVRPEDASEAFSDRALPLGLGQTISQPYVVALMTELARLSPGDRVLEVGTGSGYQAAILAECGVEVYSIERLAELAEKASQRLLDLGLLVHLRVGDGARGWPEHAPYQAILVTAAPAHVPPDLLEQLDQGGRLVVPEGGREGQVLRVYRRTEEGFEVSDHGTVLFVPLR